MIIPSLVQSVTCPSYPKAPYTPSPVRDTFRVAWPAPPVSSRTEKESTEGHYEARKMLQLSIPLEDDYATVSNL